MLLPLALAAVVIAVVALVTRRWRLARLVSVIGLLGIAVSLAIDLPKGLDDGTAGSAFEGANATLTEGFYAQLAASAAMVLCGWMLSLNLRRGAGAAQRRRAPQPQAAPAPGTVGGRRRSVSRLRAELLLPLACAGGCALLVASEFMDTFELNGPGPTLQVVQTAADQHYYSLLVLAGFALAGARRRGRSPAPSPPPPRSPSAAPAALLIFLLIDLPDAGKVGTIERRQLHPGRRPSPPPASGSS